MSSLAAVPCFSSSLRPEWCVHTPVRRLILPAYPFLSLPLTARCTCATPGCRVALQRTGTWLPTCSMALAQSCCQATVVRTSQHPELILLCSFTFCSALGSLATKIHSPSAGTSPSAAPCQDSKSQRWRLAASTPLQPRTLATRFFSQSIKQGVVE